MNRAGDTRRAMGRCHSRSRARKQDVARGATIAEIVECWCEMVSRESIVISGGRALGGAGLAQCLCSPFPAEVAVEEKGAFPKPLFVTG